MRKSEESSRGDTAVQGRWGIERAEMEKMVSSKREREAEETEEGRDRKKQRYSRVKKERREHDWRDQSRSSRGVLVDYGSTCSYATQPCYPTLHSM